MKKFNKSLSSVIIIDNNEGNFKLQKQNGILIKSFEDDVDSDTALNNLKDILINVAKDFEDELNSGNSTPDVRIILKDYRDEIVEKVTNDE